MIQEILLDDFEPPEQLRALIKLPQRPRTLDGTIASMAQWQSGLVLEPGSCSPDKLSRPGTSTRASTTSRPGTRGNSRAGSSSRTPRLLPVGSCRPSTGDIGQWPEEAVGMSARDASDTRGYGSLEQLLCSDWKHETNLGEVEGAVAELPGSQRPTFQRAHNARRPIAFGRSLTAQIKTTPKSKKGKDKSRHKITTDEASQAPPDILARASMLAAFDVGKLISFGFPEVAEGWKSSLTEIADVEDDFATRAMSRKTVQHEAAAWAAQEALLPSKLEPGAFVRHQKSPVTVKGVGGRAALLKTMQRENLKRDNEDQQRLMTIIRDDDVQDVKQQEAEEDNEDLEDATSTETAMKQMRGRAFGERKTAAQKAAAEYRTEYEAWRQEVYSCSQRLAKHVNNFQVAGR